MTSVRRDKAGTTARTRVVLAVAAVAAVLLGWFAADIFTQHPNVARDEPGESHVPTVLRHTLAQSVRAASGESEKGGSGKQDTSQPPALPSPRAGARVTSIESYFPRDPGEWQGGLVPNSPKDMAECDTSERCGLALACRDGRCGACVQNTDCATGERCVLDHCLLNANVGCLRRGECASEELCLLKDDGSPGPRANQELRSQCWSREQPPAPQPAAQSEIQVPPETDDQKEHRKHLVDADEMILELRASK